MSIGPISPPPSPIDPIQIDRALTFTLLNPELPLALFPIRLEARFLPDNDPVEIVVRVFPDDIHVDAHEKELTAAELEIASVYWETIWRAAAAADAVAAAREWLAAELGANRAIYVAWITQPEGKPPSRPVPAGQPLNPPLELPALKPREKSSPGKARLMPSRWSAFVEVDEDKRGPFWAAYRVQADVATSPALVELPEGADSRAFLDAQGLSWVHDLEAAERAGMVIRIPIAELPPRPVEGYHRLIVFGASAGEDQDTVVKELLAAQRYTRGLDFLPPGTATNATEQSPQSAGRVSVQDLFETEFALRKEEDKPQPHTIRTPQELFLAKPEDSFATALGLAGETAADRAVAAGHPAAELAHAANQALWPATMGNFLKDPFRRVDNHLPILPPDDTDFLRAWFADYVRSEGPLPTLRVGKQPYGLLPVRELIEADDATQVEYLESFLFELFENWYNFDAVPVLDPDASDKVPPPGQAAEQASDVGAIYGATPHIHQLRLRPVDDAYRDLSESYDLRIGVLGVLCALVPKEVIRNADGTVDVVLPTPDELETHPWYQPFAEHEAAARSGSTVQAQIDALQAIRDGLDEIHADNVIQQVGAFRAMKWINKFEKHFHEGEPDWPDNDEIPTGDLLGFAFRHQGRVEAAQVYLGPLGIQSFLGAERAPRLYSAGYHEEGSEVEVHVLVSEHADDESVATVTTWLRELRDAAEARAGGDAAPEYQFEQPAPFLQQLLQSAVATVTQGERAGALRDGIDRMVKLIEDEGVAAIGELERLLRSTIGLAIYRVDAWITSLASKRLADLRVKRPSGLQVGGYGWLVNLGPREGKASQGHIHAPSLDHAVTAAVLRSGWSAFGTADGGSPLAVNLSSERVRAAKSLIEGVRAGRELGRLIGARFERRLHDRNLDQYIDDVRAAVLDGAGHPNRPPTRLVDGLLLARAFTTGIELTGAELAVKTKVDQKLQGADHEAEVRAVIEASVGDLDAVADLLFSQAVHGLLRGDAGVAAPTLAATGSGDSGLPAIDLPKTLRGGALVTLRVVAMFGTETGAASGWPGASSSVRAVAEPRLERWVGLVLGSPSNVVIDIEAGAASKRLTLAERATGALDALYGADALGQEILASLGLEDAKIAAGRPKNLPDDHISFDEFVTVARSLRVAVGRIRALSDSDFETEEAGPRSWDATDLQTRLATARGLLPPDDPRLAQLATHETEHPGATANLLIERLHILTVDPVPILPIIANGVPQQTMQSFRRRGGTGAASWFAQAAKTRPAAGDLAVAVQMAELAQDRPLLRFALAQTPDQQGRPWAGFAKPSSALSHTCWCSINGDPPLGPVAGFVVDSWTEMIPETRTTTGVAVHFDRPSATAPHAVLLVVTRDGQRFSLDYVSRCLKHTLRMAHFRALDPDEERYSLGQFLPAFFLPGDLEVLEKQA